MFVDNATIEVKAGNGGNGLVSFRREKYVEMGGPNGGDGGNGGNIIFKASNNEHTLSQFRYQRLIKGEHGQQGGNRNKHGKSADHTYVVVPTGTIVSDAETGEVYADLTESGQEVIVARGGKGGFGNAHFKTSTRQAPLVAEKGTPGEEKSLRLELKLIADVAIVGLPNAGKSTFLSVVSNARPDIANYAFTTLSPNLGVVDHNDTSILFADIPGLIEGAHAGKGLGHEFLRHVERTKAILHLIDAYNEDPVAAYQTIRTELTKYSQKLAELPEVVAISKVEGLDQEMRDDIAAKLLPHLPKGAEVSFLSSQAKTGIDSLLNRVHTLVSTFSKADIQAVDDDTVVYSLSPAQEDREWRVEQLKNTYIVTGSKIERFAQKTYFDDFHSVQRLQDIMRKLGIIHELDKQGYQPDQEIIFGKPEIGRITL